ncbi:GNAT family N-acetyltransferase [Bradyrhizobium jicamae]|uniref:GNAT family N-acetyltransferase n=1 Tax=Bradyrhizobium jicamae TaxID=280332 RepID=A0ABS5FCK8_9BRAD|nr:GNAT family N-acetyltransferase [Bradyrhizobium jicamae]MBR0794522.1 GNAT family N-acetyltransferase [Bradyrhizobium jicamae]MBR0933672.1 GNAT family N-acetyltransferase [Bradyrhizobium jicamae]
MILPDGYSDVPTGKIAAVVTHLEMTSPPPRRDDPPGAWRLRKAETPKLDWYRDLYRRVGEEWLWFSRARMSDAELAARIHAPDVEVYALVVHGNDEGLLELDFSEAGNCELVYFGVTASLVSTGAGRYLMNRAMELAWRGGVQRVWVHTCTFDHPSAVAFYQRSGFRAFRRQIEIADDPRLDGTAPRDTARHVPAIE